MTKRRAKEKFTRWHAVDHLKSEADIAAYLNAALEAATAEGGADTALLAAVLGDIARARGGMPKIAARIGMSRQGLYKALAPDGNPSFETVVKVTQALGFDFKIQPHAA